MKKMSHGLALGVAVVVFSIMTPLGWFVGILNTENLGGFVMAMIGALLGYLFGWEVQVQIEKDSRG